MLSAMSSDNQYHNGQYNSPGDQVRQVNDYPDHGLADILLQTFHTVHKALADALPHGQFHGRCQLAHLLQIQGRGAVIDLVVIGALRAFSFLQLMLYLGKAFLDREDILTIEERLSEVQYELESRESTKRTYDNQINYSTVTLYLREVQELTPTAELTVWERISQGFMDSVEGLAEDVSEAAVWIIIHLPYLVAWGIVLFIVILIVRGHRRRRGETSGKRAKKDKKKNENIENSREDAGKTADSGKKEDTT